MILLYFGNLLSYYAQFLRLGIAIWYCYLVLRLVIATH